MDLGPCLNMNTTCFCSMENFNDLAFKRHGLLYHLVELLDLMLSSLWTISFVCQLHFHCNGEIFDMLEHVAYHVYHQPLCNVFPERTLQIMTTGLQTFNFINCE